MTIQQWIKTAKLKLEQRGVESPVLDAQLLVAHTFHKDRSWVLAHPEQEIDHHLQGLEHLLDRRLRREPLAYILGSKEFYGRNFILSSDVLIPRPETETLIEVALEIIPQDADFSVLDIGTGSGCIAITLSLERPNAAVNALDISEAALNIAKQNAQTLNAKIIFIQSDGFNALPDATTFDLIVSNPPYIERNYELQPEVKDYEPSLALYGDDSGLSFYKLFANSAHNYLKPNGYLLIEHGFNQANSVKELFVNSGWQVVRQSKDLYGHSRTILLQHK